ncbi:protein PHLOEM PROTEIN 2-LIKE A1-like [Iris pallida]|uniref:Protein PHLOEM PROTEIN 2-LIKE A1-like n=1 Tax=Iris pallida TaxID=29817 RepID=A0AAX6DKU5_IRIPA|nr:protein PHLOEM PROTEIN 2-LIKE A1-like [Iris pallida]
MCVSSDYSSLPEQLPQHKQWGLHHPRRGLLLLSWLLMMLLLNLRSRSPEANSAAPTTATEVAKKPDTLPLPEVAKAKEAAAKALSALAKELTKEPAKKVPHMYEAIVQQADDAAAGDLLDRVRAGIFLNNKKKAKILG